jgi:hypothetical protein
LSQRIPMMMASFTATAKKCISISMVTIALLALAPAGARSQRLHTTMSGALLSESGPRKHRAPVASSLRPLPNTCGDNNATFNSNQNCPAVGLTLTFGVSPLPICNNFDQETKLGCSQRIGDFVSKCEEVAAESLSTQSQTCCSTNVLDGTLAADSACWPNESQGTPLACFPGSYLDLDTRSPKPCPPGFWCPGSHQCIIPCSNGSWCPHSYLIQREDNTPASISSFDDLVDMQCGSTNGEPSPHIEANKLACKAKGACCTSYCVIPADAENGLMCPGSDKDYDCPRGWHCLSPASIDKCVDGEYCGRGSQHSRRCVELARFVKNLFGLDACTSARYDPNNVANGGFVTLGLLSLILAVIG